MAVREPIRPLKLVTNYGAPVPQWMREGYASHEAYEEKTVALVQDLFQESKEKYASDKIKWKRVDKLAALEHVLNYAANSDPSETRLPTLIQAIEEYMSARLDESLIPSVVSRQQAMDPLCQALNYMKDEVLDDQRFQFLKLRMRFDQLRYRIGFFYIGIDPRKDGIFGYPGRHIIERIDPRCIWPDAYARDWSFDTMRYLIIARPMDITEIARTWPDHARRIASDPRLSGTRAMGKEDDIVQEINNNAITFQGDSAMGYTIGRRDRALVLECYIRDGRVDKVAAGYNPDGTEKRNLDGGIIPKYVDRYPNGRKIVVCGDVLLEDRENPYPDGEPPIVAFPESPYEGLFSFSPLEALDICDRKVNKLAKSLYNNLEVNMSSPLLLSNKAFLKQSQYDNVKVKPGQVWQIRDNTTVKRLEPGLLPPETMACINFFAKAADAVLGTTDVSRGNLEAGTEISAQTVQDMQISQAKRARLKGEMDKESMQQVGKKLCGNIRKWSPGQLSIAVKDPSTGKDQMLFWDSNAWKDNWVMKIEVASSSPGAKQSFEQQAVQLYKDGVVDGQYTRDALKIPPEVGQRIDEKKKQLAALGLPKEAQIYPKEKGTSGRKSQVTLV